MTKKKLLTICGIAAGIPLLAAGGIFGHHLIKDMRERHAEAQMTEDAETLSVRYIEQKYGLTPELVSVTLEKDGALFESHATGRAKAILRHEGREFQAVISLTGDSAANCDDFQQPEIEAALLSQVNAQLSGGEVLSFDYVNRDSRAKGIRTKFDGSNLEAVIAELEQMNLSIGYYAANLRTCTELPFLQEHQIFTKLIAFGTKNDLDAAMADTSPIFDETQYLPLIADTGFVRPDGIEWKRYDPYIQNGFFLNIPDGNQESRLISRETDADVLLHDVYENLTGWEIDTFISKAFSVQNESAAFYDIYVPVKMIGDLPDGSTFVNVVQAMTSAKGAVSYQTYSARICGGYALIPVSGCTQLRFAFFNPKENQ